MFFSFSSSASYCLKATSNGNLRVNNQTVENCKTGMILLSKNEYDLTVQAQVITALEIAESFTWGFATYIGFWFLGYAIKNARMVVRKV